MEQGPRKDRWLHTTFKNIKYKQIVLKPDEEVYERDPHDTNAHTPQKAGGGPGASEQSSPTEPAPAPGVEAPPSPGALLGLGEAGILYAASSALFLSLCSVLVKLLDRFEPAELAAFRFVGILVPSLVSALSSRHHLFPSGRRWLLLLRSLLGATSLVCKFYALRNMSLADASVILLSVPVFVGVFARVFLREPCGWLQAATVTVTLAGMLLITRPSAVFGSAGADAGGAHLLGSALAFTSTLAGANVYVTMRLLKGVPATVIMTVFASVAAPLSLFVCLAVGDVHVPRSLEECGLLVALGVCSFLGQLCLTRACHAEQASLVAVVRTVTEVMFAVAWQFILFDEVPTMLTGAGMVLIIVSVILVGLNKWLASLPDDPDKRPGICRFG
ncbi:solute carrier family 35 member G1-like [Amphibalanus amphitrite]|uniref:solute carrier family 35 member G1-like n=1 Tax=Amphibalanus amphitrite TaxID=1232801 RepID=UPI001C8FF7B6|nr:solute carrier family 35 member G1-like [Amphibalanus amphitrite]